MISDSRIQKNVIEEIKWQPFLNPSSIGVSVNNGVVTLSGQVDTYYKKLNAVKAAKKVAGVKAVAEDIIVGLNEASRKTDTSIAEAALNALKWHPAVQDEKVKLLVDDGIVKLEGEVEWAYQKNNATMAIENLTGVKKVLNFITVKPRVTEDMVEKKILAAFQRSATVDSHRVVPEVFNNQVTLTGKVRSLAEKFDAEEAAWNAPGIISVNNKLEVEEPTYELADF